MSARDSRASNQTGWTGLIATLIQLFGETDPARFLELGAEPERR